MDGVLRAECSKVLQEMNLFCLNNEITEPESSPFFWCHDQVATLSNGFRLPPLRCYSCNIASHLHEACNDDIIWNNLIPDGLHLMANEILKLIK